MDRRCRTLADKESRRWLAAAHTVAQRFKAASCVVVGDRESDIYALFSRCPASVDLLVRCAQNRGLDDGSRLFDAAAAWPVLGVAAVQVPPRGPGARAREAQVSLRAGSVVVRCPRNAAPEGDADGLTLTLVEATEAHPPEGEAAPALAAADDAAGADQGRDGRDRAAVSAALADCADLPHAEERRAAA